MRNGFYFEEEKKKDPEASVGVQSREKREKESWLSRARTREAGGGREQRRPQDLEYSRSRQCGSGSRGLWDSARQLRRTKLADYK